MQQNNNSVKPLLYNRFLYTAALLYELLLLIFVWLNLDGNIPLYMFIYFETFLLFFLGWYLVKKMEPVAMKEGKFQKNISKFFTGEERNFYKLKIPLFIILTGILFRLTLIPTLPSTSPDVYRYLWEGKVIVNGYNPYGHEPSSPELLHLQEKIFTEKVTYPRYTTVYPPVSQYIFALSYVIGGSHPAGIKLMLLICEILTLIFLLKLLIMGKKNPSYVILYAWLPLPVMEYFVNGHHDAAGIMFLVLFIYFFLKGKVYLPALLFTLAVLVKFLPLILLPLVFRRIKLKRFLIFLAVSAAAGLLLYLPFTGAEAKPFDFLVRYVQHWEFNGSVYSLIKYFSNGETAKIICGLMLLSAIALITVYNKYFINGAFAVIISYFIFASTVYPWYLGWAAVLNPFMAFYSAAALFFTINLSNFTPLGEVWKEYTIVLLIEYVPFFLLLIYDWRKGLEVRKS